LARLPISSSAGNTLFVAPCFRAAKSDRETQAPAVGPRRDRLLTLGVGICVFGVILGLPSSRDLYKNSAPIFDPRRHLTRARRPELAFRDINKVNMPGTASVAGIAI